ncbi:MAG TPA: VanZ family protein [Natronosporangium sp.]
MLGWAAEYLADPRTPIVVLSLVLLAALVARPLALLTRWPVWTTAAMLQAAAVVGILTLGPAPGHPLTGPDGAALVDCVQTLGSPSAWWEGLIATGDRGERVGNVLMFMPLGCFAVLVTKRPVLTALVVAFAPSVIELSQVLIGGGRDCAANDWLNNATGGLLGVLVGWTVLRGGAGISKETRRSVP